MKISRTHRVHGFSLIELLVVLAIIAIVTAFSLPNLFSLTRSSQLTTASQALVGNLELARQTALTKQKQVEVRFYLMPAGSAPGYSGDSYRAFQLFLVNDTTTTPWTYEPLTMVISFPPVVSMVHDATKTSFLALSGQPLLGTDIGYSLPMVGTNYKYLSFHFKPSGQTDLDPSLVWFSTLVLQNDPLKNNGLPNNFITVQIDPVTGRGRVLRP